MAFAAESDWRDVVLEDLAAPVRNALVGGPFGSDLISADYAPFGVPVIRGENLSLGRWVDGEFVFVSSAKAEKLAANTAGPLDIVFTQRGANHFRQVAVVPPDAPARLVISQSQMKITVDRRKADPLFVYYLFRSPTQQEYLQRHAIETGVPHTNLSILRKTPLRVPSLSEQQSIVRILGALDDKIELNRRMNETLEAMARAIFKSWFVDFDPVRAKVEGRQPVGMGAGTAALFPESFEESGIDRLPHGWRAGSLSDLFVGAIGGAWGSDGPSAKSPLQVACLRGIDLADLDRGDVPTVPRRFLSHEQVDMRSLSPGDLLIEGSGSNCGRSLLLHSGISSLFDVPLCYSNFVKRLVPKASLGQAVIGWHFLKSAYMSGDVASYRTGTAFPNLDVEGLVTGLAVVIPSQPVADKFAELFLATRATALWKQSRTLADLRDTLLPKLLSGEVRVKQAEKTLTALATASP